jgi:hypothetical protein
MADPVTIIMIASLVGTALTFILNIFQSIKSNHFKSSCLGCNMEVETETQEITEEKK